MNAIGWEGIYVVAPEYTFNNLVLHRMHHHNSDQCIEKYHLCRWHEISWQGSPIFMEQVDGLLSHIKDPTNPSIFLPVMWNLH